MLDLIKYIVEQFAEDKESIEYEVNEKERVIEVTITLPASDMGKVIGKHGKIARAIRLVMKSASNLTNQRVSVEIR